MPSKFFSYLRKSKVEKKKNKTTRIHSHFCFYLIISPSLRSVGGHKCIVQAACTYTFNKSLVSRPAGTGYQWKLMKGNAPLLEPTPHTAPRSNSLFL